MMPPSSYRRPCLWLIVVAGPAVLQLERHNGSGLCCTAAAWSSSPHNVVVALSVRRRRTMPAAGVPVFLPAARNDDDDDGSVDDDEDKDGRIGRSNRKFTGRSSRLFDSEATTNDTARKIPYEREMNLASRFEQTLPVQALLLALAIAFVAYVGLSGGITDGSERYFFDDDEPSWTQSVPYPNDDVTTTTTDSVYI
jgi:hypothetical protein